MPDPSDPAPGLETSEVIALAMRYTRTAEKIAAAISNLTLVVGTIAAIAELDPSLKPELTASLSLAEELVEALTRAFTFVDTRLDVVIEQHANKADDEDPYSEAEPS